MTTGQVFVSPAGPESLVQPKMSKSNFQPHVFRRILNDQILFANTLSSFSFMCLRLYMNLAPTQYSNFSVGNRISLALKFDMENHFDLALFHTQACFGASANKVSALVSPVRPPLDRLSRRALPPARSRIRQQQPYAMQITMCVRCGPYSPKYHGHHSVELCICTSRAGLGARHVGAHWSYCH